MHVIRARNVAEALPLGVEYLTERGQREDTRAGSCLVAPGPVTTVYEMPTERVLFSKVRDANPFFHLAEISWMLTGRKDSRFLENFVADFGKFAESGGVIHGAYGHRWRSAFGFDQLDFVVEKLRGDHTTRQCVIQMWDASAHNAEDDELRLPDDPEHCDDLRGDWKDRPCNTHVYLRIRGTGAAYGKTKEGRLIGEQKVLDITVCCRSNDMIWGGYGANAVHFSALQEYLAARIGVGVGRYYQVSNNFHVYESEIRRLCERGNCTDFALPLYLKDNRYRVLPSSSVRLVNAGPLFDQELKYVLYGYECLGEDLPDESIDERMRELKNEFLSSTLWPALRAHYLWKHAQKHSALTLAAQIASSDWRVACVEWMERRKK